MLDALRLSLNASAVTGFLRYISVALLLFWLFQFIYTRITPHREFSLIRETNPAAAIALGGPLIGVSLPASTIIAYSVSILDLVALVVIA
ncbi:DUF350 domain-containing protein, partial [Pseudomonas urethralis]|uniref:DUF350 domain-containing protein n=1 Tax=Pseudomonas urethralis TaxID=2740517 RepID=UPI0015967871